MLDWSRRHALKTVAVAGALALAGCSGGRTSSDDEPPPPRDRVTDVEATKARNSDGEPLFVTDDGGTDQNDGDFASRVSEMHHLTDEEDVEQLRFRDGSGAADLEAFVTATDLDAVGPLAIATTRRGHPAFPGGPVAFPEPSIGRRCFVI